MPCMIWMRNPFFLGALTVVLNGLFTPPLALAHDFWLEPSQYQVQAGKPLTLSFREGHGEGAPLPRNDARLVLFELHGPAGSQPVAGVDRAHPAGAVPPLPPGLYQAVYLNTPARQSLTADRFESYLQEKGLAGISALRAERGESAAPGQERFYRCAKVLFEVGGPGEDRPLGPLGGPLGLPLELVAGANPYRLAPGASLPVQVLFEGQPLAGVLVVAHARDEMGDGEEEGSALRSDASGWVRIPLDAAGRWRLQAVHMTAAPAGSGVDWQSWWASLTFKLPKGEGAR